jgi:hypothetical protein
MHDGVTEAEALDPRVKLVDFKWRMDVSESYAQHKGAIRSLSLVDCNYGCQLQLNFTALMARRKRQYAAVRHREETFWVYGGLPGEAGDVRLIPATNVQQWMQGADGNIGCASPHLHPGSHLWHSCRHFELIGSTVPLCC